MSKEQLQPNIQAKAGNLSKASFWFGLEENQSVRDIDLKRPINPEKFEEFKNTFIKRGKELAFSGLTSVVVINGVAPQAAAEPMPTVQTIEITSNRELPKRINQSDLEKSSASAEQDREGLVDNVEVNQDGSVDFQINITEDFNDIDVIAQQFGLDANELYDTNFNHLESQDPHNIQDGIRLKARIEQPVMKIIHSAIEQSDLSSYSTIDNIAEQHGISDQDLMESNDNRVWLEEGTQARLLYEGKGKQTIPVKYGSTISQIRSEFLNSDDELVEETLRANAVVHVKGIYAGEPLVRPDFTPLGQVESVMEIMDAWSGVLADENGRTIINMYQRLSNTFNEVPALPELELVEALIEGIENNQYSVYDLPNHLVASVARIRGVEVSQTAGQLVDSVFIRAGEIDQLDYDMQQTLVDEITKDFDGNKNHGTTIYNVVDRIDNWRQNGGDFREIILNGQYYQVRSEDNMGVDKLFTQVFGLSVDQLEAFRNHQMNSSKEDWNIILAGEEIFVPNSMLAEIGDINHFRDQKIESLHLEQIRNNPGLVDHASRYINAAGALLTADLLADFNDITDIDLIGSISDLKIPPMYSLVESAPSVGQAVELASNVASGAASIVGNVVDFVTGADQQMPEIAGNASHADAIHRGLENARIEDGVNHLDDLTQAINQWYQSVKENDDLRPDDTPDGYIRMPYHDDIPGLQVAYTRSVKQATAERYTAAETAAVSIAAAELWQQLIETKYPQFTGSMVRLRDFNSAHHMTHQNGADIDMSTNMNWQVTEASTGPGMDYLNWDGTENPYDRNLNAEFALALAGLRIDGERAVRKIIVSDAALIDQVNSHLGYRFLRYEKSSHKDHWHVDINKQFELEEFRPYSVFADNGYKGDLGIGGEYIDPTDEQMAAEHGEFIEHIRTNGMPIGSLRSQGLSQTESTASLVTNQYPGIEQYQLSQHYWDIHNTRPSLEYIEENHNSSEGDDWGPKLQGVDVAKIAHWAGWQSKEDTIVAVAIAYAESRLSPRVVGDYNVVKEGDRSLNIWQNYSSPARDWDTGPRDMQDNLDTLMAADNAHEIYTKQGWEAWTTFKNGDYLKFIDQATKDVESAGIYK